MEISAGLWIWRRKFDTCAVCCMLMILCYIWNDSFQNTGTVGLHSRYRSKDVRDLVRLLQILNPHFGVVTIRLRWCRNQGEKKKSQNRHLTFKLQLKFFDLLISPVIVLFATCLRCVATHRNNLDSWPSSWGASKTPQLCHELPIKARRRCDDPAAPMLSHRWSAIRHPKSRTSFTQIYCVPHNIKGKVQEKKKRSNDLKRRCSACHPSPKRRFLDLDQRVPVELASTPKGEPKAKNIYIE